ncbi:hypothetical protein HMI54_012005 [Coelomomyces lativittatus]|nr:hypothetical protein HMI56_002172 [Coelomomyces lativittatus]KAJ1507881.1 hypothetical protein HMI55_000600 [Coelomomyces lativittatus]KAJ1515620.1 hypothetical protein HMI54_012005 [Coelomomyces lativittatus]
MSATSRSPRSGSDRERLSSTFSLIIHVIIGLTLILGVILIISIVTYRRRKNRLKKSLNAEMTEVIDTEFNVAYLSQSLTLSTPNILSRLTLPPSFTQNSPLPSSFLPCSLSNTPHSSLSFPSSNTSIPSYPTSNTSHIPPSNTPPLPPPNLHLRSVITPYIPAAKDELYLTKNDLISQSATFDDGWGFGFNLTTGFSGVFPICFTIPFTLPISENLNI